jgi:hypothetical protein
MSEFCEREKNQYSNSTISVENKSFELLNEPPEVWEGSL